MENNKLFKAVEGSTQDIQFTIKRGNSERWAIQSQKTKYINGKLSGVTGVGYTASINNTSDYLLEEDKSNNEIQITAQNDGTSGLCILTQNESGNKINLHLTTPEEEKEYWEIRFKTFSISVAALFDVNTNINGESGSLADGPKYRNWIVNQSRNMINVYIHHEYTGDDFNNILSWSCLDKDGKAFNPNYDVPDNQYFTIRTIGLGSYTLTKVSQPPTDNGTIFIFPSGFSPTKKYPLLLNFYWGSLT